MRRLGLICALAALAGLPVAEVSAKKIAYPARFKAKNPGIAEGSSVGVLNFGGRDGENFGAALSSELQAAKLDEKSIFQIKTLDSLNFDGNNELSRAEVAAALRLGQKLGVKTVITGVVIAASATTNNFNQTESVCVESKSLFKCVRSENRNVPCSKITGQYSVSPRAITVSSGAIVYSEVISRQGEYTICNGQLQNALTNIFGSRKNTPAPVSTPEALLARLRQEAAMQIRQQIAPYNQLIEVELKDKAAGLSKPDQVQFSNAIAFGNAARMDRACSIFETLNTEANANNVALLYNLGVCAEVLLPDDPVAALTYYAKADQFLARPDKLVSDAFVRTKRLVGEQRGIGQ